MKLTANKGVADKCANVMAGEGPSQRRRSGRMLGIAAALVALAVFVAVDLVLSYALVPYGGKSETIWWRYYQHADDDFDTVIAGTSYAMQCIDPGGIDAVLGSRTFSLATPNQSPTATLVALEDAYEDHHIRRAIVGVSIESVLSTTREVSYDLAFVAGEAQGRPLAHALATYVRVALGAPNLGNAGSLAALVPWSVWNTGFLPTAIRDNVVNRQTKTPDQISRYITEQGFAPVGGKLNPNKVGRYACVAAPSEYQLDEGLVEGYRDICRFCARHDVELVFVSVPWMPYLLLRYEQPGGYARAIEPFVQAMTDEGATFLDCALLKKDVFRAATKEFYNEQHLNTYGAIRFSKTLGDVLRMVESGEDVSPLFYARSDEGWAAYRQSVGGLSVATFTATPRTGAIDLAMKSFAGTDYTIEYEVQLVHEDGTPEVLRPYDTSEAFSVPTTGHGVLTLRMNARIVGSGEKPQRSCERTILY